MGTSFGRTWGLQAVDHALLVGGVGLLALGLVWSPWVSLAGWTAFALALFAWLAESSGYPVPRPGRLPVAGLGCSEAPLAFSVTRDRRHYLFTRGNGNEAAPFPDEYSVFEVERVDWFSVSTGFVSPPAGSRFAGRVAMSELRFEHHNRCYVDAATLGQALRRLGTAES